MSSVNISAAPAPRKARVRLPWLLVLLLAAVLVFQGQGEMVRVITPPSAAWSRPLTLASAPANGSFTQVALADGRLVVIWATQQGFQLFSVAPDGAVTGPVALFSSEVSPAGVKAVLSGDAVYMFWEDFSTHTLRAAAVAPDGTVKAAPRNLATGVKAYAAAAGGSQNAPHVLALTADQVALYGLSQMGDWTAATLPLTLRGGLGVDLQSARDGTLYGLAATEEDRVGEAPVHILLLQPDTQGRLLEGAQPRLVAREVATSGLQPLKEGLSHLSLGLDTHNAYVFWDVQRNDRGERSTISSYVTWPVERPPAQPLEPAGLSALPNFGRPISGLSGVVPAPGQAGQLVTAAPATLGSGRDRVVETLELTFQDGKLVSQQLAGPSTSMTLQPLMARSGQDRWLTWVQPRGNSAALLVGGTAESFRKAMGRVRLSDWLDAVGNTVVNIGYAYVPALISLAWVFPTLMLIVAAYLMALNWAERHGLILNLVGIVIYLALKVFMSNSLLLTPPVVARMPAFMAAHVSWVAVGSLVAASLELLRKNRRFLQAPVAASLAPLILYDMALMALIVAPYVK